jgi:hypothetical protein
MPEVAEAQPLSMSWCLDCHRNPEPNIRPNGLVTSPGWDPLKDWKVSALTQLSDGQEAFARRIERQSALESPTNCSACHR